MAISGGLKKPAQVANAIKSASGATLFRNDLGRDHQDIKRAVDTGRGAVNATVQYKTFREEIVLQVANQNRAVLGGQPISTFRPTDLKTGLTPPTVVSSDKAVNITLLERDIQNLRNVTLAQNQAQIAKSDEQLRALIATIRSDPQLLRALSRLKLTELGMTLIDETGAVRYVIPPGPLVSCANTWNDGNQLRKLQHDSRNVS